MQNRSLTSVVILGALILSLVSTPARTADDAPAVVSPSSGLDQGLLDLRGQLDLLLRGELPDDVPASRLFGISLTDPTRVAERIGALEKEVSELETRVDAMRARAKGPDEEGQAIDDDLPAVELRLDVAEKRLRFLERFQKRLVRMGDASRRILPTLGEPRMSLRKYADAVQSLSTSVAALAQRMQELEERSKAGMLVGFISEQRALVSELDNAAQAYAAQARQLSAMSSGLQDLAVRLEREGQHVAAVFFRMNPKAEGSDPIDELFAAHLQQQRRLRKGVSERLSIPSIDTFESLSREARGRVLSPQSLATTQGARDVLDDGVDFRQRIDSILAAATAGLASWELAFENELVTLLSEQASEEARASAYRLSNEIITDVTSEVQLAWAGVKQGIAARQERVPTLASFVSTIEGRNYLLRTLYILSIAGAWLVVRRQVGRITVAIVKGLRKLSFFRRRIGLLVRASGLLQSVTYPLVATAALYAALGVGGFDNPMSRLIETLAFPMLVYWLGRQLLLGATQRITPGRPALIEVKAETLARMRGTYASLGLVFALAYAFDGVVRIAVGAGRLASLVAIAVVAWVGVWVVWEAVRWRTPLARAWSKLAADSEHTKFEIQWSAWMGENPLGFLLSPVALIRVVGTPVLQLFAGLASATSLAKSFRAYRLRRRTMSSEPATSSSLKSVPAEYLEAFPLHPVLGEDDALILPRETILDEVFGQFKTWQDERIDGSLVLIGEKGSGKTTVAAQIARGIEDLEVNMITVMGKPTTAEALISQIGTPLGCEGSNDGRELAEALREGPERVVLLDEAHNLFLRVVDGYRAYDALVDLVNSTTSKVFWVIVFNSFTWRFLNESRGRVHYFRKLLFIPPWTPEEIQELIFRRNKQTGFDLEFDAVLLSDEKSGSSRFELVEEAEGYFRLLWESSGGNPRIASRLWLSSLSPLRERTLRVGMFREPSSEKLSALQDDLVFALAALSQHENLSGAELARVLNLNEDFGRFAIQYLSESGFIEPKDAQSLRYTISSSYYRVVLKALRNKHLLYT